MYVSRSNAASTSSAPFPVCFCMMALSDPRALRLGRLDDDVGGLSADDVMRLVDHDARVGQRVSMPSLAGAQQHRRHGLGVAEAHGVHGRSHVLHDVVDGEAAGDDAAAAVDVEDDGLLVVHGVEEEELADDGVRGLVVDAAVEEDAALAEELRVEEFAVGLGDGDGRGLAGSAGALAGCSAGALAGCSAGFFDAAGADERFGGSAARASPAREWKPPLPHPATSPRTNAPPRTRTPRAPRPRRRTATGCRRSRRSRRTRNPSPTTSSRRRDGSRIHRSARRRASRRLESARGATHPSRAPSRASPWSAVHPPPSRVVTSRTTASGRKCLVPQVRVFYDISTGAFALPSPLAAPSSSRTPRTTPLAVSSHRRNTRTPSPSPARAVSAVPPRRVARRAATLVSSPPVDRTAFPTRR